MYYQPLQWREICISHKKFCNTIVDNIWLSCTEGPVRTNLYCNFIKYSFLSIKERGNELLFSIRLEMHEYNQLTRFFSSINYGLALQFYNLISTDTLNEKYFGIVRKNIFLELVTLSHLHCNSVYKIKRTRVVFSYLSFDCNKKHT